MVNFHFKIQKMMLSPGNHWLTRFQQMQENILLLMQN